MDSLSPTEIGAQIYEAGASRDLQKLMDIAHKCANRDLKLICDIYSDFSTGWRVLHHAAEIGNFEICDFLLTCLKVFVDIPSFSGDTPLILAAKAGHANVVECLIRHEAHVEVLNKKGFTPLHYAALNDNMTIMEMLMAKNPPLEIDSADGTVLQFAATNGNLKAVKLLLRMGADPTSISLSVGTSALVCAIKARSFECMKCLLKAKANTEKFGCGLSPLACAARESDIRYLKALLTASADVNKTCKGGFKPLEHAAMVENDEAVKILFPLTAEIATYPKWTIEGVRKYNRSKAAKDTREAYKRKRLSVLHGLGQVEMSKGNFSGALVWYSEACYLDPNNPRWLSIRSLCNAKAGKGVQAVIDAEEAIKRNPQKCPCPKPHYSGGERGVAWQLFKRYHMASIGYVLSPNDDAAKDSYRVALFQYFSWLYLTSCPGEMMIFLQRLA